MASIGITPPINYPATGTGASSTSSGASSQTASAAADPLANESTFLTLLVSQLKNQNPMNPMDGTTFVTQLAQFSDLEQNLAMRQDLDTLTAKYAATTPAAGSASGSTSGDTSGSTSTGSGTSVSSASNGNS